MTTFPNSVLRTLALHTQKLNSPNNSQPTRDEIFETIHHLGCVQIDTLNMVHRSHYLVLWSRLGNYDPSDFDVLASAADRRIFEGWQHAASFIPLNEYRYQLPRQRSLQDNPDNWYNRWLNETVQKDFVPQVLERIRCEGPLKVSDFESDGHPAGSWWNWRPAKIALEFLNVYGKLMVTDRAKFQRVYDLSERILPSDIDMTEPTREERDRFWVERGAKALGVFLPRHAGDYTWMKVSETKPIVDSLLYEGILLKINGESANGKTVEYLIHRDNLPLLGQIVDGAIRSERTTFLSPFDNLWWANRRDEQLWGFHQSLEAYLPASKRIYGYFCLPILHKGQLVGRFDPKMERKTGVLRLKVCYLEPTVKPDDELIDDIVCCLRDFMAFHAAKELVIDRSEPADFGLKLIKKMSE